MKTLVFAASPECERELEAMGFKKEQVWVHNNLGGAGTTPEQKARAEHEMFSMKHPPFMFVATSWWGMGAG